MRTKGPIRHDDTVYDKARIETKKGLDSGSGKEAGSGKSGSQRAKPLPVAKPLEGPGSEKKAISGPNPAVKPGTAGKPGSKPAAKVPAKAATGAMRTVATAAQAPRKSPEAPTSTGPPAKVVALPPGIAPWVLIAGSVAALVLAAAVVVAIVIAMGGFSGANRTPGGGAARPRDTSSLNTDGQRVLVDRSRGTNGPAPRPGTASAMATMANKPAQRF